MIYIANKLGIWKYFLFFLFSISCKPIKYIDLTDYSLSYSLTDERKQHFGFTIFHANDSLSFLYYGYDSSFKVYAEKNPKYLESPARIGYKIARMDSPHKIVDSSSKPIESGLMELDLDYFIIKQLENGAYNLELKLFNQSGALLFAENRVIIKSGVPDRNDFIILDQKNQIVFEPYISEGENFNVILGDRFSSDGNFCLLKSDQIFPNPPFNNSEAEIKFSNIPLTEGKMHDTTQIYSVENQLLCFDPGKDERLVPLIYMTYSGFPAIDRIFDQVMTTRYLLTKEEFEFIQGMRDQEKGLYEFWRKAGENSARAMLLRQEYNNRAEKANKYFTSFKYGWSTDRGMIYMVFGVADHVYLSKDVETWVYHNIDQSNEVRFDFVRKEIYPGIFDYLLQRSFDYRSIWMKKVEFLRN